MAKANVTRRIRYSHVAKDAEVFEIWPSYDNIRVVKKNGTVSYSPPAVSLTVFRIVGTERTVLDVPASGDSEYSIYCTTNSGHKRRISSLAILQSQQNVRYAPMRFDLVRTSAGSSYGNADILACCTLGVIQDGEDGSNAAFTSVVFKRQDDNPGTPSGGSYSDPIPPGWSDAPESGTEMLWVSRAKITPDMDGSTEAKSPVWSAASPCADSTDVEFLWSAHEDPGNPTEGLHPYEGANRNTNWSKDSTGAVWMAVAVKSNGKWQAWRTARVKGEQGEQGEGGLSLVVSPQNVVFKKSQTSAAEVLVNMYSGDKRLEYGSGFVCSVLNGTTGSSILPGLAWDYRPDTSAGFRYRLTHIKGYDINTNIPFTATCVRSGVEVSGVIHVCTVADGEQGDKGDTGPAGPYVPPPMKWEDYPDDYWFEDGGEGCSRLDVVLREGMTGGRQGLVPYKCVKSHTKATTRPPGNPSYWAVADAGVYEMVATKVLLAQNAYIDFLSGRGVRVYRDNGTVMATMEGGGTPLYIGGQTPEASPFRVNERGKMFSTDADISGRINALSGFIGNLEIKGNDLVGYDSNGVQRVRIGVGSVPKVDDVFEVRNIAFSMSGSGNVHVTQPSGTNRATAYMEASFDHNRDDGVSRSELFFTAPAVVGFRLDTTATKLEIGHIDVGMTTNAGSIPNWDQETGQYAYAYLYRIAGSNRMLVGRYDDLHRHGNEDIVVEGDFPAAQYELQIYGGISQSAFGSSEFWTGRFYIGLDMVQATFLNDTNNVSGQTIIAADGFISIQSNTRYARFTMDGGFESRYGNHGFRVGANGIQKLNASGSWVACNI